MMEMKMTQFIHTHEHSFRQARSGRRTPSFLGGLVTAPLRWVAQAWVQHRDERLLQSMSDTQLRDLGISRGQIYRAVRDGLNR
jgi:uncharacterized protein YjiS (DUF1127 family)